MIILLRIVCIVRITSAELPLIAVQYRSKPEILRFQPKPPFIFPLQIQSISSCFNILKVSSVHNIIHTGIWVVISSLLSEHGYLSNLITIVLQYTSYYILIYHRREIIFSYSLPFIWLQHGIILFHFSLEILH